MSSQSLSLAEKLAAKERRLSGDGRFSFEEVQLALRNRGIPMEALRYEITPSGLHYLLTRFEIPDIEEMTWRLEVGGLVERPLSLSLNELRRMPRVTEPVTMECAGNGRAFVHPRPVGQPWIHDAVSTARWTGVRLRTVLEEAGVRSETVDVVFWGADHGIERGYEHTYARSLRPAAAARDEVMLAYEMNGVPLEPQHGAPLRLIVPGWHGMASVKWLTRIEAIDRPFDGYQQFPNYHYRQTPDDAGEPVMGIKVRALIVPPGFPDLISRARVLKTGPTVLTGRAWSGFGAAVTRVEVGINNVWRNAELGSQLGPFAWRAWRYQWDATAGEYELACRATDAAGSVQPLAPYWTLGGMGNNMVQKIPVLVRP